MEGSQHSNGDSNHMVLWLSGSLALEEIQFCKCFDFQLRSQICSFSHRIKSKNKSSPFQPIDQEDGYTKEGKNKPLYPVIQKAITF
jgi:hypothetical protein